MVAVNENGVASTPRYVEGVCFGEYDTITHDFIPQTNPVVIPKGEVMYQHTELDNNGVEKLTGVTGIIEDKGLDIASKKIHKGFSLNKTPNVETRDKDGNSVNIDTQIVTKQSTPVTQNKQDLPVIDWSKLFT